MSGWATEMSAPDLFFATNHDSARTPLCHARARNRRKHNITGWHQAR